METTLTQGRLANGDENATSSNSQTPLNKVCRKKFSRFRHKEYQCDDCERMFTLKHNLQNHFILYHMGCKTLKKPCISTTCQICFKIYSSPSVLNDHMQDVHNVTAASKECDECHKKFLNEAALTRHMKAEHEASVAGSAGDLKKCPFENCKHDGFRFVKELNQHIRDCHRQAKYTCSICAASYTKLANKERHEKSHMGPRLEKERNETSGFVEKHDLDSPIELEIDEAKSEKVSMNIQADDDGLLLPARARNFHPELEAMPIKRKVARRICRDEILAKIQ
ncbi:unnamed protein product [Caenorhabditis bovis]|uniref:C2H2-type domain-containing protein n=1 Tax=Caenorhabditis bovis TaxID=2654633 RepID=A0A8S1EN31_9PELO|nr:unnamed protein product [Caenorhabditis bovis]